MPKRYLLTFCLVLLSFISALFIHPKLSKDFQTNANLIATSFLCKFNLAKATTAEEQAYGLMFITHLNSNQGMLFIFNTPQELSFWMANTFIPLDIIFLDTEKKITTIYYSAQPLNTNTYYTSIGKAQYVIELPSNTANKCSLTHGETIHF